MSHLLCFVIYKKQNNNASIFIKSTLVDYAKRRLNRKYEVIFRIAQLDIYIDQVVL